MKLAMLKMVIVFEREISYKYSGICTVFIYGKLLMRKVILTDTYEEEFVCRYREQRISAKNNIV